MSHAPADDVAVVVGLVEDLAPALPGDVPDAAHAVARASRVVYRLLYAVEARRRGAVLTDRDACRGLPVQPSDAELAAASDRLAGVHVGEDPAHTLGGLHQALLTRRPRWNAARLSLRDPGDRRRTQGSWFTPRPLVRHLLGETVEPTLREVVDRPVTVCDPSCGSGAFLVAAARLLARETGRPMTEVVERCVHGVDRDPLAVELTRVSLWLELTEPGSPAPMPPVSVRAGDALLGADAAHLGVPVHRLTQDAADAWCARHLGASRSLLHWELAFPDVFRAGGFDVVVGNPPFLNRLQSRTARPGGEAALLEAMADGAAQPYTDVSAVFLHRAVRWLRPGGRVGLVQPQSVLAARDTSAVRADLAVTCALQSLWGSDVPLFDASVLTCAPVLRRAARQGPVRLTHGPGFRGLPPKVVTSSDLAGTWSFLLAQGLGVPEVVLPRDRGALGDLARCTADFRDQYYGLAGHVHEGVDRPGGAPLVTAGLIDPASCSWGRRQARFLKRRWEAPVVDLETLPEPLRGWAGRRLVPKVLVATQGPVVEAVADPEGRWLPSVPVVTVAAEPEEVWRVLAVLLAPPVTAYAAAAYAGTALTMRSLKLSARQVAGLPLPGDRGAWDEAAAHVEHAQRDPARRRDHLMAAARLTVRAYAAGDDVLPWWAGRLRDDAGLSPAGR